MNSERREIVSDPLLEDLLDMAHAVVKTHEEVISFENSIKAARDEKTQKLTEINSKPLPKGVSKRLSIEALELECKQKVKESSQPLDKAKKELNLRLNKAILDTFSYTDCQTPDGKPLILSNFQRLVDQAHVLDEVTTAEFMRLLSGHTKEATDYNLFLKYSYRKSKDLVATTEDCQILKTALDLSMRTDEPLLSQLADSYFQFLRHKVSMLRNSFMEGYPFLGLVYDIYTAGFFSGDLRTINQAGSIVGTHLGDLKNSVIVGDELKKLIENYTPLFLRLEQEQDLGKLFFSTEHRLYSGLFYLSHVYKSLILKNSGSEIIITIAEQSYKEGQRMIARKGFGKEHYVFIGDFRSLKYFQFEKNMAQSGIYADLAMFLRSFDNSGVGVADEKGAILNIDTTEEVLRKAGVESRAEKIRYLRDRSSGIFKNGGSEQRFESNFFEYYPPAFFSPELKEIEKTFKENDNLWNEVLDNSVWFVSPRGDRFAVKNDPELYEKAIESVTFQINRRHPREHRVLVKFEPYAKPIEFWLTTDRNILIAEHLPWTVDPRFKQAFANLILKRLYYITSGVLKEEVKNPQTLLWKGVEFLNLRELTIIP